MNTVNIKLYNIFRNDLHLTETKAKELVEAIKEAVEDDVNITKHEFKSLWKDDFNEINDKLGGLDRKIDKEISRLELKMEQTKTELSKTIYVTGFIQFVGIVGSVISLILIFLHK